MAHWQELVTFAQQKTAQIAKKHCRVICWNQKLKNEFVERSLRVLDAVSMHSNNKMEFISKKITYNNYHFGKNKLSIKYTECTLKLRAA